VQSGVLVNLELFVLNHLSKYLLVASYFYSIKIFSMWIVLSVHFFGKTQQLSVRFPFFTALNFSGVGVAHAGVDATHVASKGLTSFEVLFAGPAVVNVFACLWVF
jgi:hypothetical protein